MTDSGAYPQLPEPDEHAPIGSNAHRAWYLSTRNVCGELIHGCHLSPPLPCVPCLRTKGHDERGHAKWWNYDDEYPGQPRYGSLAAPNKQAITADTDVKGKST